MSDPRVLLVEDSDDFAALVQELMSESGFSVHRTSVLKDGERAAADGSFACAFVDLDLPDASGLESVMALRVASPALPLVVLSGQETGAASVKAMLAGAQDWVPKHEVSTERLEHAVCLAIARQDAQARLAWTAAHDAITGLPNRPSAIEHLARALGRASRRPAIVAVLFCDLDGFKAVNDRFGHAAGDAVLSTVAHRLISAVRPGDVVARWAGDEFVISADAIESGDQALTMAQRIRKAVAAPMAAVDNAADLTVSVGIVLSSSGEDPHALVDHADQAMLRAKRAGTGIELALARMS